LLGAQDAHGPARGEGGISILKPDLREAGKPSQAGAVVRPLNYPVGVHAAESLSTARVHCIVEALALVDESSIRKG